jgi:hypothetical protein
MGGMQLCLVARAEDENGADACAEHSAKLNEGGHAWMYKDVNDALRLVGWSEDMLLVCTLCSSRPCPREKCPLWNKGKRVPTAAELEAHQRETNDGV